MLDIAPVISLLSNPGNPRGAFYGHFLVQNLNSVIFHLNGDPIDGQASVWQSFFRKFDTIRRENDLDVIFLLDFDKLVLMTFGHNLEFGAYLQKRMLKTWIFILFLYLISLFFII